MDENDPLGGFGQDDMTRHRREVRMVGPLGAVREEVNWRDIPSDEGCLPVVVLRFVHVGARSELCPPPPVRGEHVPLIRSGSTG
jgi:hypothetical protein